MIYMKALATAMKLISLGTYVIGLNNFGKKNLMTTAWISQISSQPPMLSVAISKKHYTAELLEKGTLFSISVLTGSQKDVARRCGSTSGRDHDKLTAERVLYSQEGLPLISQSAGYIICQVTGIVAAGDHFLYLANVIDGKMESSDVMLYKDMGF